jgi:hypothetical protein
MTLLANLLANSIIRTGCVVLKAQCDVANAFRRQLAKPLGENSLEGPQENDASFYGPGKLRRPSVASFLFSFPSTALPLDPFAQSVRV